MKTFGKIHRLQRCATPEGKFNMLALDHRNNLLRAFNPEAPESVPYRQMADFKRQLVARLSPASSGVLLDPQYGVPATVPAGVLAPGAGLVVAVEKTGYTGDPNDRRSQILPGWSVEKIARLGADGVKLLIYYHPQASNAEEQESLVQEVGEQCRQHDLPFFLEPLSFSLDPAAKKLTSAEKRAVVTDTARRLTPLGVDVLKAEFPVDTAAVSDETAWADACSALTEASRVPWILLSAGVSFDEFERQTLTACRAGASGVLAGRAVWKEAIDLSAAERQRFLQTTAVQRMQRLGQIIAEYARPWTGSVPDPNAPVPHDWYRNY